MRLSNSLFSRVVKNVPQKYQILEKFVTQKIRETSDVVQLIGRYFETWAKSP
jgi:hypothetical protein